MAFFHRQRRCIAAVVIPSHLGQPFQGEICDLVSLAGLTGRCVPAPQKLLPHTGEGEERRPRIHPPAVELDAPALPANPGIGFQQSNLMSGASDQGCRGQTSDAAAYYDHPAQG
jgi:hypothetical protein